ncbi:MAG: methylenetetrahydrofolate reductase [Chloroflexia bacterium]|nr:methylenetetrahydrofolate reductase [Chloroflexia bacterium]
MLYKQDFTLTVEVVPPAGPDAAPLLEALQALDGLPIDGFSVASNPVAHPRLSALALCALIQQHTGRPATLHCTTRDHNRLSLQGLLWGARALGIESVLVTTGDFVALGERAHTTTVRDVDVFDLLRMAREAGLHPGAVLDPKPETDGLQAAVRRLERKAAAGARFAVTQPLYDESSALEIARATRPLDLPIILGVLPLRSPRHAEFLHQRVAGIAVPQSLRDRLSRSQDSTAEGLANARGMLDLARRHFAGACLMPPFDRYEILSNLLNSPKKD